MPKEMFYKIPLEKQEMFINVAIDEFTSKSFEQASINSIVKKANISRGSFYNYFEDIEELIMFVFEKVKQERFQYASEIIKSCDKDYFIFIRKLFEYDFDSFKSTGRYTLFRNFIHFITVNKKGSIRDIIVNPVNFDFIDSNKGFEDVFDFKKYGLEKDSILDLIEMTMILAVNTFLKSESEELSKEEVIKIFNHRMNIIEFGARKRAA